MPTPLAARRVHFDSTQNLVHPISPTSSSSSLDTDGPETPPSPHTFLPPTPLHPKPAPPYPFSPAPSSSSSASYDHPLQGPMAIHPLLAPHTPLEYDLARPLDPAALTTYPARPLPHHTLLSPATSPSVPALTITLAAFACPREWAVHVTPSTAAPAPYARGEYGSPPELVPYVTVADVLAHLYAALRTPASKREWAALDARAQERVGASFFRRCGAGEERRKGVKRVDWLGGRTRFGGVAWTGGSCWELVPGGV